MGPEATAELYLKIIRILQEDYGAKYDSDYPEIFIYNLPIPDVVDNPKELNNIRNILIQGVKKLESQADFIAIPCNTVNYFLEDMRKAVSIPILSIPEETGKYIKKIGLKKVGLLATELTINKNVYANVINNIEIINPTLNQQKILTKIIMNILSGNKTNEDKKLTQKIINDFKSQGAEKVILGCTDLPLLINSIDTIDTIGVLARSVVNNLFENKKGEILNKYFGVDENE